MGLKKKRITKLKLKKTLFLNYTNNKRKITFSPVHPKDKIRPFLSLFKDCESENQL